MSATVSAADLYGIYAADASSVNAYGSVVTGSGSYDYFANTNSIINAVPDPSSSVTSTSLEADEGVIIGR